MKGSRLLWLGLIVVLASAAALALITRLFLGDDARQLPSIPDGLAGPVAHKIESASADVRSNADSAEAWGRLAATFHVHDLLAEAMVCYERAEMLDPSDFRWPYFLARCVVTTDQRAALDHDRRAVALRDDYAPLHVRLGRGFFFVEDLQRAREHFGRAVGLDPGLVRAHIGLARVALAAGETSAAIDHAANALDLSPGQGEIHQLLAEAHRQAGDLAAARRHLELGGSGDVFEPLPDPVYRQFTWDAGATIGWYQWRADAHRRAGRLEDALAEWQQAVRDYPESAEVRARVGRVKAELGRFGAAINAYRRALRLDPDYDAAREELAVLLERLGRDAEAAEARRKE